MFTFFLRSVFPQLACAFLLSVTALAAPIRVGFLPDIGFAPLHVADSMGFWKDRGVQVQLVPFDDSKAEMKALVEGRIDVASDLTGNFVGWAMSGAPIKITAETHTSNGSIKILLRQGFDPSKLAGQPIGIPYNQVALQYILGRYLNANGVQFGEAKLQEGTPDQLVAAFEKGQLAAVVLSDPDASILRDKGAHVVADSATYPGLITEGFAASNAALAAIPDEQWVAFYRGWLKAVSWVRGTGFNWAAFQQTLKSPSYHKFLAAGDIAAVDSLNSIQFGTASDIAKRHGNLGGLEYYVRAVLRFMHESAVIKTEPEARPLIHSTAFEKALKEAK